MQVLSCYACLRHCLRAVAHRAPLAPPNALVRRAHLQRSPSRTLALALQRRRSYATEVEREPDAFDLAFGGEPKERTPKPRAENREPAPRDANKEYYHSGAFKRHRTIPYYESKERRDLNAAKDRSLARPEHADYSPARRRNLENELAWFGKDPLRLADNVKKRLEKGKDQEVLDIVRLASKSMDCTVSWNHIIDHYMSVGHVNQSLKVYNEMKKRGQKPDSYTYMIVIRGLGNNAHLKHCVGTALAVYHSMSAPNSQVTPSIKHANAVLKACARANDMDALWGVASKLPERGPGAADAATYTTILQAMTQEALVPLVGLSADDVAHKREETIIDGRRIWDDIVSKWRAGNIVIDEGLACAMGRMLLIGQRPRDWDDVLSLFNQTMDIPRLIPHLGAEKRPFLRAPDTPREMKREDFAPIDPTDNERRGGEFDPVRLEKTVGGGRNNMAYATPGKHTLATIIEACLRLTIKKAAEDYWNLLTAPDSYGIVPDEASLHMYLRILRQARGSAQTVEFIRNDFKNAGVKPKAKTFRIAMSTCQRDINNRNVFKNATDLLDLKANTLTDPDARTLALYTDILFSLKSGEDILSGLEHLGPHFVNLKSFLNYGKDGGAKEAPKEDAEAAIKFLRGMKGLYDRLMNRGEVPRELYSQLTARKAKVDAYYTRAMRREIGKKEDVRNPQLNPERRAEIEAEKQRKKEAAEERQRALERRRKPSWGSQAGPRTQSS